VRAPREVALELHGEDGDVRIRDRRGDIDCRLDDGDVHLDQVSASVKVHLEDGNLRMADCTGNLDAQLDDGDVDLVGTRLERCRIRTEDGDVTADLRDPGAIDLDLGSADGDVKVTLEAGARAGLSLHSEDGTIDLDLGGVSDLKRERGGVSGRLGDGKGRIRIRTEGGDIALRDVPGGGKR